MKAAPALSRAVRWASPLAWTLAVSLAAADGVVIVRVVDDAGDRPLPARVYVTGADGQPHLPRAREGETVVRYDRGKKTHEVYACVGAHPFRIDTPAGTTVLTVERGKEYPPVSRTLDVADGRTIETTVRLRRRFDMAALGWYSGEMHVHSGLSRLPAMQLADDLNVAFPITAWSMSDRRVPTAAERGEKIPDKGELVSIDDTHVYWNLNTEYELDETRQNAPLGGFLILGHTAPFTVTMPPITPLVREARRQGAFLEWDMHTWPWSMMVVPVAGIDTIPLSNCHMWRLKPIYLMWGVPAPDWMNCAVSATGWAEYGFQAYYALLNSGFVLRPSAGTANGVHPVPLGHSRVYVKLDGPFRYEKWKAGLLEGRSFVTNGPMLFLSVDGREPGDRRALAAGETARVTATVEVRTAGEIDRAELVVNGRAVPLPAARDEAGSDEHRRRFQTEIDITGSAWVAARCFDKPPADNVRFAHTAPIFFDDPTRPLRPERRQIAWLIDRVRSQIDLVKGKVSEETLAEYERALKAYQAADKP